MSSGIRDRQFPGGDWDNELEEQEAAVADHGQWQPGHCEKCGSPTMWRWTNLRAVARTGDERLASKEVVPAEAHAMLRILIDAMNWYEQSSTIGSGSPPWYEAARKFMVQHSE